MARGTAVLPSTAALAHAGADDGPVSVVIGFGTEPAYAGLPNSVQVLLEHDGGVLDGATDLTVHVTYGDDTTTYGLEPYPEEAGGAEGEYRAWFVPSQPGPYTFHIEGDAGGEEIDVEMTSGPATFAQVLARETRPSLRSTPPPTRSWPAASARSPGGCRPRSRRQGQPRMRLRRRVGQPRSGSSSGPSA